MHRDLQAFGAVEAYGARHVTALDPLPGIIHSHHSIHPVKPNILA